MVFLKIICGLVGLVFTPISCGFRRSCEPVASVASRLEPKQAVQTNKQTHHTSKSQALNSHSLSKAVAVHIPESLNLHPECHLYSPETRHIQTQLENCVLGKPDNAVSPILMHAQEIVFGLSLPLNGEKNIYSQQIISGLNAKIFDINTSGGIKGKSLRLVNYNDFGKPSLFAKNVKKFQEEDIRLQFGGFNARGVLKVLPLVKDRRLLMLFPYISDRRLESFDLDYLFLAGSSMEVQVDKIINLIQKRTEIRKIALFYADTDIERTYAAHADKWLSEVGFVVVHVMFDAKKPMIFECANQVSTSKAGAVFSLTTYKQTWSLITSLRRLGNCHTVFYGTDKLCFLQDIFKNSGIEFYYTSLVPSVTQADLPIVQEYIHNMKKYCPNQLLSIVGLTYYINATLIERCLKKVESFDPDTLHQELQKQLELVKEEDLGGFIADFDYSSRQMYPLQPHVFGGHNEKVEVVKPLLFE